MKMNMGVVGVLLGTVLSFMASAIAVPIAVNKEICIHMRDKASVKLAEIVIYWER